MFGCVRVFHLRVFAISNESTWIINAIECTTFGSVEGTSADNRNENNNNSRATMAAVKHNIQFQE